MVGTEIRLVDFFSALSPYLNLDEETVFFIRIFLRRSFSIRLTTLLLGLFRAGVPGCSFSAVCCFKSLTLLELGILVLSFYYPLGKFKLGTCELTSIAITFLERPPGLTPLWDGAFGILPLLSSSTGFGGERLFTSKSWNLVLDLLEETDPLPALDLGILSLGSFGRENGVDIV